MRVLAIDCALEACSAAVLDTGYGGIIASETLPMMRGHAEALMPLIARVMAAGRHEFRRLDRIAVTIGPGSFTGLRVGIAAARGIALAAGKPAVGLSTLAASRRRTSRPTTRPVVAAIDARHDHVYLQVFGPGGRTLVAPRLAPLREAVRRRPRRRPASSARRPSWWRRLWPMRCCAGAVDRRAGAGHRLGRAAWRRCLPEGQSRRSRNTCGRPTRSRRTPPNCHADDGLRVPPARAG